MYKLTFFGQTKKLKEAEYYMRGSHTFDDLPTTHCTELPNHKDMSKIAFIQIEKLVLCKKEYLPLIRKELDP